MTLLAVGPMPAKDLEQILTELGKVSSLKVSLSINEIDKYIKKYFQERFGLKPAYGEIKQVLANINKEEVSKLYRSKGIRFESIEWHKGQKEYTITLDPYSSDLDRVKGSAAISYEDPKFKPKVEELKQRLEDYGLKVEVHAISGYILSMK